jgi:hypothetical protein
MLTALRTHFYPLTFSWPLQRSDSVPYGANHAHLPRRPNTARDNYVPARDNCVPVVPLDGSGRTHGRAANHFILLTALQHDIGAS